LGILKKESSLETKNNWERNIKIILNRVSSEEVDLLWALVNSDEPLGSTKLGEDFSSN
jgi:hypothetical protein